MQRRLFHLETNIREQVAEIYWNLFRHSRYNPLVGMYFNEQLSRENVSVQEMLERSANLIRFYRTGDFLHFSLALMVKLKENGIDSFLVSLSDTVFSVGYQAENHSILIAHVPSAITSQNIDKRYCKSKSSIPLSMFQAQKVKMYSSIWEAGGNFFPDYLQVTRDLT